MASKKPKTNIITAIAGEGISIAVLPDSSSGWRISLSAIGQGNEICVVGKTRYDNKEHAMAHATELMGEVHDALNGKCTPITLVPGVRAN